MKVKQASHQSAGVHLQSGLGELELTSSSNDLDIFCCSPYWSDGRFAVSKVRSTRYCILIPVTLSSSTSSPSIVYFGCSICGKLVIPNPKTECSRLTSSARATKESVPSGTSPSSSTCAEDEIWTKVFEDVERVYGTPETYGLLASLFKYPLISRIT